MSPTEFPLSLLHEVYMLYQKRPTLIKRDLRQSKETYVNQKRPTLIKRDLR